MGFDDVTRQFTPKPTVVRLECRNCGNAPDNVLPLCPLWYNHETPIPLCMECYKLEMPTSPELIQERITAIAEREERIRVAYCG